MKHKNPHPNDLFLHACGTSNADMQGGIDFDGAHYPGPVELHRSAPPEGAVPLNTFLSRFRRLAGRDRLSPTTIKDALHTPAALYKAKYAARKTWITVDGNLLDLRGHYLAAKTTPAASFAAVRTRLRGRQLGHAVTKQVLDDALAMSGPEWITYYGGGRHRTFVYNGEQYPEHQGVTFHGIAAFLRTVGRYADRALIWNRMKSGWTLDDALVIPVDFNGDRTGSIYRITRVKTGQVYVGLTISSVEQRWAFHLSAVRHGSKTRLAQAIREDGPELFSVDIIESNIADMSALKAREIFWAAELGALGANGLNTAPPGQLGRRSGIRTQDGDETFHSDAERFRVLGARHGVPAYVAQARIKNNTPLPWKARTHSKNPEAGTEHFRRWLALRRRHPDGVDDRWVASFNDFLADTVPIPPGHHLVRPDASKPWGKGNFMWGTPKQRVEHQSGKPLSAWGVVYPSMEALAARFGFGVSTLKDRIRRQGLTVEAALELPLGRTSRRSARLP